MQMESRRPSGGTHLPNLIAPVNRVAGADVGSKQVPVSCLKAKSVVDGYHIAVGTFVARKANRATGGGEYRLPAIAYDIETGMKVLATADWISAQAPS
jgi:hypothetical protein